MSKFRKAIAAGMSAALLASLFTVIAASTALASTAVTGVGSVPRGGTSTNTAVFTFTEETAGCISTAIGGGSATFTVTIAEHTPPAATPGNVTFTGTPVVTAPGIMGATASISSPTADTLSVKITGSDPINKQQITVTGLKIKAKSAATLGAITATLSGAGAGAAVAACFLGSTGHPTGTITTSNIPAGSTAVTVTVTSNSVTCPFDLAPPALSTVKFGGANVETVAWTASTAVDGSIRQTLTIAATTADHVIGDTVTASTSCPAATIPFAMTSPGTVVDVAVQDVGVVGTGTGTPANVNPGEQNQGITNTYVYELTKGFIASGTVITFKITTPGVLFSASPTAQVWTAAGAHDNNNGLLTGMKLKNFSGAGTDPSSAVCNLSFDRTSCTVTTDRASDVLPAAILLTGAKVDVASTVTAGTAVNIAITGPSAVRVDNQTVAYVSRVIVGVAAQPTIFINFNDQQSGQMSLTEQGAGFFTDGSVVSPNNVFGLCVTSGETFTRAPWAVVTTGDLKLLSGLVGATSVRGTLYSVGGASCAKWTVYSASTVASTIEIRGSDAADAVLPSGALNGPRYSVPPNLFPGATLVNILVGNDANVSANNAAAIVSKVSNAVRVFKSDVVVTALGQPNIVRGGMSHAGDIQISETLAGQFKPGDVICLQIQARATNENLQDTWFDSANTNQIPKVTTNTASGLLAGPITVGGSGDGDCNAGPGGDNRGNASFRIAQQSFGPLGVITISNINYITVADAPNGNVLVRVFHRSGPGVQFSAFISNAKLGIAVAGTNATRLGATQVGAFTISTKVQHLNRYVTYRIDFGVAAAGAHIDIWGATKTGNDWSAFTKITTRVANASGVVYYYIRQSAATWKSYRGAWAGGGVMTLARQARWR